MEKCYYNWEKEKNNWDICMEKRRQKKPLILQFFLKNGPISGTVIKMIFAFPKTEVKREQQQETQRQSENSLEKNCVT